MNITQISINRPSLIIVIFSVFALLGIIGFKNLGYELLPDFNQPVVVIKTMYPGAEPNEVETSVSRKIEDALSNLEGVDYLETKSMPNASIIIANFMANQVSDFFRFKDAHQITFGDQSNFFFFIKRFAIGNFAHLQSCIHGLHQMGLSG